jgi:hypothetical protein
MEETMFDAGSRPMVRLFYLVLTVMVTLNMGLKCGGAAPNAGTTMVSDTVYLADGTTAQGSLIITWPAFVTASGTAVAGGSANVVLGNNGALSVALVPNEGANPAGVYYSVVYQLGPAVASREIVDADKFRQGISLVIDGTVQCLNASTWAKKAGAQ